MPPELGGYAGRALAAGFGECSSVVSLLPSPTSTLTKWPHPTDLVESWEASHATGTLLQLSGTDSHSLSQSLGLGPNIMKTFFSSLNVLPEGLVSPSPG